MFSSHTAKELNTSYAIIPISRRSAVWLQLLQSKVARYDGWKRGPGSFANENRVVAIMDTNFAGELISWAIGFFGCLYALLLGYRVVGTPPGKKIEVDLWYERNNRTIRVGALVGTGAGVVCLVFIILNHLDILL